MIWLKANYRTALLLLLGFVSCLAMMSLPSQAQRSIDVRVNRWLSVQSVSGDVFRISLEGTAAARVGDRLSSIGDGVRTAAGASSVLEVDTGIGTIDLSEETELLIRDLSLSPNDGRITHLYVPYGGVAVKLRRFTNLESEFEIETPSGVSGVRGTEFGVNVQSDGNTGIATRTGEVYAEAESVEVTVPDGFQTLIVPGNPPLEPTPIPEEPFFEYRIDFIVRNGLRRLALIGTVDPINRVFVDDELQVLSPEGEFSYDVPARRGVRLTVTIATPLGDETEYEVPLL